MMEKVSGGCRKHGRSGIDECGYLYIALNKSEYEHRSPYRIDEFDSCDDGFNLKIALEKRKDNKIISEGTICGKPKC